MEGVSGETSRIIVKNTKLEPWEVLKSSVVFAAEPWIKVLKQAVRLPTGAVIDDYHHIVLGEFSLVFAQTTDGSVIVERQYKHGVGKVGLVLPAGSIEPGEDPLAATHRVVDAAQPLDNGAHATVAVRSAGSFVTDNPELFPNIIKVDVEGFEGAVFDGLKDLLPDRRLILVHSFPFLTKTTI